MSVVMPKGARLIATASFWGFACVVAVVVRYSVAYKLL